MAKLEKRQIIILGVMAVVILYGAFDFLMPKGKSPTIDMAQKNADLNAFTTGLTASLGKDTVKSMSTVIFSRAEKDWQQDPFLDSKSYKKWNQVKAQVKEGTAVTEKIDFIYSGYLEVNRKRMAIINGVEYKEGDALDIKGFFLKNISPTRVVIENRVTKAALNIALQE
jgi:hypothetical protein